MRLVIQIPCFNEEETVNRTLADLPRSFDGVDDVKVVVIDDGSVDRTAVVALEAGADYVVRHAQNRGLAAAFRTGIDVCMSLGADVIVNTDGDNQYPGHFIPALVRPIVMGDADLVIGDRRPSHSTDNPLVKRVLNAIGNTVIGGLMGRSVSDAVSGFRAFSREAALAMNTVTSFSYTIESLLIASELRLAIRFVPIHTNAPTRRSRLCPNMWHFVLRSGGTFLRVYTLFHGLAVFSCAGAACVLVGLVPIARFLWLYAHGSGSGHVQSLVLACALWLSGLMLFSWGVIADVASSNRRLVEISLERLRRVESLLRCERNSNGCGVPLFDTSVRMIARGGSRMTAPLAMGAHIDAGCLREGGDREVTIMSNDKSGPAATCAIST